MYTRLIIDTHAENLISITDTHQDDHSADHKSDKVVFQWISKNIDFGNAKIIGSAVYDKIRPRDTLYDQWLLSSSIALSI